MHSCVVNKQLWKQRDACVGRRERLMRPDLIWTVVKCTFAPPSKHWFCQLAEKEVQPFNPVINSTGPHSIYTCPAVQLASMLCWLNIG